MYLLKIGTLDNAIQDFLLPLWYMSQYILISKYSRRTRPLKSKNELKHFSSRNNGGHVKIAARRSWMKAMSFNY